MRLTIMGKDIAGRGDGDGGIIADGSGYGSDIYVSSCILRRASDFGVANGDNALEAGGCCFGPSCRGSGSGRLEEGSDGV